MVDKKSKVYDVVKFIALIVFPASIALYSTLAATWGWPHREAVTASLSALNTFIGAILVVDSKNYFKDKQITQVEKEEEND